MLWKKEANMKYTDMCIYIDENVPKIVVPGEHPEIEDKIYNYLWLLVKALAIKRCMFNNFGDYDGYAFYAANRLYFALRKNQTNQGKVIKGKLIRPIKSCLNYTKALLNPMRIEYQNETYRQIIDEEFISKKFDAFTYKEQLRSQAAEANGLSQKFKESVLSSMVDCGSLVDKVLTKSPFQPNSVEYKRLKISIMLNCNNLLKTKKRLDVSPVTIVMWKLPKSMSNYVRVLLKEFVTELKKEILDCYNSVRIDDEMLDKILSSASEAPDHEDQY